MSTFYFGRDGKRLQMMDQMDAIRASRTHDGYVMEEATGECTGLLASGGIELARRFQGAWEITARTQGGRADAVRWIEAQGGYVWRGEERVTASAMDR